MILKRIKVLTELKEYTNTYIIQDEVTKETMVVDPGGEVDKIVQMLDILGARLKYIYLTHCHGDHIGGVCELKNKKGGIILIHRFDAEGLENDKLSLTTYIGIDAKFESDSRLNDNDLIDKVPVVIITGNDTKDAIKEVIGYQVLDVLNKPFSVDNIKRVLSLIENFHGNNE